MPKTLKNVKNISTTTNGLSKKVTYIYLQKEPDIFIMVAENIFLGSREKIKPIMNSNGGNMT
ncbi:MAG: hypothetical protein ACYC6D_06460 [Melioribacteraceae bacterium]